MSRGQVVYAKELNPSHVGWRVERGVRGLADGTVKAVIMDEPKMVVTWLMDDGKWATHEYGPEVTFTMVPPNPWKDVAVPPERESYSLQWIDGRCGERRWATPSAAVSEARATYPSAWANGEIRVVRVRTVHEVVAAP